MSTAGMITLTPQQLQDLVAGLTRGAAPVQTSTLTWGELWATYFAAEQNKLIAWKTRRTEGGHIVRLLGDRRVTDATIELVRWYRGARRSEINAGRRNRGKPASVKTINNEVSVLLHLLKWANRQSPPLIPVNPLASINRKDVMIPVDNVRINIVDDAPRAELSLAQFLAHGDPLDRALVLVAHSSGMRRREIALLERGWIDWPQRLITIPPGISKGTLGRRKGRVTIVSQEALDAIDEYRRTLSMDAQATKWVFVNSRNNRDPFHPDHLSRRFQRLRGRVGLDGPSGPVWLHDLRRSFITLARRRGEDAVNVMQLVGHSTLEAQQRYHVGSLQETKMIRDRIEGARATEIEVVRSLTERGT